MELDFLRWIQSGANPALDWFFLAVTETGTYFPAIVLFTILYWLFDKETGELFGFTLLCSSFANTMIKGVVDAPRPIGEEGIRSLAVEGATGSSFPSAHSQMAVTTYWNLALILKKRAVSICMAALILLVGFSRLYLGVHYPRDVLAGLVLGVVMTYLCRTCIKRYGGGSSCFFARRSPLPCL